MRMVVIVADGRPVRLAHDAVQAEGMLEHTHLGLRPGQDVQLWEVPVGRSFGPAEQIDREEQG